MSSLQTTFGHFCSCGSPIGAVLCGVILVALTCFPAMLGIRSLGFPAIEIGNTNSHLISYQIQQLISSRLRGESFDSAVFKAWPYDGTRKDELMKYLEQRSLIGSSKSTVERDLGDADYKTKNTASYLIALCPSEPLYFELKYSRIDLVDCFRFRSRSYFGHWHSSTIDFSRPTSH